jgi:hypothetical protein
MDLKQLQAMGAIVPRTLLKREVTFKRPELKPVAEWANPEEPEFTGEWLDGSMTVFIRRGSSADALEIANASPRERPFVAVFRSICDESGTPMFPTLEDAMQLANWLAFPLFNAITEAAGGGPKNSRPGTSSGANSRSGSVGGRSQSGRKRSPSTKKKSGASTESSSAR